MRPHRIPPIREVELWLSWLVQGRVTGIHPSRRIGPGYDLERLRRAAGPWTEFLVLFTDESRPIHVLLDSLERRTLQLQASP